MPTTNKLSSRFNSIKLGQKILPGLLWKIVPFHTLYTSSWYIELLATASFRHCNMTYLVLKIGPASDVKKLWNNWKKNNEKLSAFQQCLLFPTVDSSLQQSVTNCQFQTWKRFMNISSCDRDHSWIFLHWFNNAVDVSAIQLIYFKSLEAELRHFLS